MTADEPPRRDPQPSSSPSDQEQNVSHFELGERLGKLEAGHRHLLQFAVVIFTAVVSISLFVLSNVFDDIDQMALSDHSHDLTAQLQQQIDRLEFGIGALGERIELLSSKKPTTVGFLIQPNSLKLPVQLVVPN